MERYFMDDFQIEIPFEKLEAKLHISDDEDLELMRGKLEEGLAVAKPRALYRICSIDEVEGDKVIIEGTEFRSETLASRLKGMHHVFAYVVTCGREVDEWSNEDDDYVMRLWLDILKEMILNEARRQFQAALCSRYEIPGLSSMNPGAGNLDTWPIDQQVPLFSLLQNVTEDTGVVLTDGYLMYPTKSVSGVLFPSEKEFVTCSLCKRENCPNRRAPFKGLPV